MYQRVIKQTLAMAGPMMTTRLVQTVNTFVSMAILAQLGHVVLAASLPISMFRIVVMLTFISPLFVLGAVVGRQMHAKGLQNLPGLLVQMWLLALLLSVIPMILYFSSGPLMQLLHQPAVVVPIIAQYLKVQAWGMPAILILTVNQQFLAGMKHQHWVTKVSVLSLLINGVLCFGLTLGQLGMPAWGVFGSALAGVVSMWVTAAVTTVLVLKKLLVRLNRTHFQLNDYGWVKLVAKIGTPVCLQVSGEMLSLLVITVLVGWLGEVVMAASQISQQYMLFAIVPIFGLSEAASIRVGHAIADNKTDTVPILGQVSLGLCIAVVVLVAAVFAVFHRPLAEIFLRQSHVSVAAIYQLAMWLLVIRVIAMVFDGVSDVLTGLLRGLYDTRYPMLVSLLCSWGLMLPAAYLGGFTLGYGMIGMACGSALARLLSAGLLVLRWQRKQHGSAEVSPVRSSN